MLRPTYQAITYENLAGLLEDHISDPMQAFWVEVTSILYRQYVSHCNQRYIQDYTLLTVVALGLHLFLQCVGRVSKPLVVSVVYMLKYLLQESGFILAACACWIVEQ